MSYSTARACRIELRDRAYQEWCKMPVAGVGVTKFKEHPRANRFMYGRTTLSSSEWTTAIKLSVGYANVRGDGYHKRRDEHGQTLRGMEATRCRRCDTENESIQHVLGSCPYGELMRNARHNKVKHTLTSLLRGRGFDCLEEVQCTDHHGSIRKIDILAFEPGSRRAYIVDPTVRYEANDDIGHDVLVEKEQRYAGCANSLNAIFGQQHGQRDFRVFGLWVGGRGTISTQMVKFFEFFRLDKRLLPELGEMVLSSSIRMLHHHVNGP